MRITRIFFTAFHPVVALFYISFFYSAAILPVLAEGLPPVIELQELEHDFGDIHQGVKLSHDFTVKNAGNSDLIIREINPSCGCTAAVLEDPVIPPGKQTAIRVTFDTTGFAGNKSKTVRIYSNDPARSSEVLRIKANIVPEIVTEPSRLEVFNVKKGELVEVSFIVKSTTDEAVSFKEVVSKSNHITVASETTGNGEILVTASVSPDIPTGKLRSRIVVRTNNPRVPVINVPVLIDVVRDIMIEPVSANFGYISGGINEPVRRELRIRKRKGAPDDLNVVKHSVSGSSGFTASIESSDTGDQILYVDLMPGAKGVVRGTIVLDLNHEDSDQKQVEVPVYAVVDNEKE
jgi:hypothetical protein